TEYLQWSRIGSGYQVTVTVQWKSDLGMQKVEIDSYVP
ncbi:MAG: hypothetical protein JWN30_1497, partial [Bacilli bacterium]|nr:hypothetical protein [Bacilli bacterium]